MQEAQFSRLRHSTDVPGRLNSFETCPRPVREGDEQEPVDPPSCEMGDTVLEAECRGRLNASFATVVPQGAIPLP
jgi:hypothetical protein